MSTTRHLAARVAAALTLVATLIGPPLAIGALIGRPWPDRARLADEISLGRLTTDTTMRVAALLFVVVWAWAVVVIGSEALSITRARRRAPAAAAMMVRADTSGPSGALHRLVRIAMIGSVTTAATVGSWTSIAAASLSGNGPFDEIALGETVAGAPADATEPVSQVRSTRTIVSNGRATPLSIAVDLGDESLRDEIIDLNTSSSWTGGVFPAGTAIVVPIGDDARTDPASDGLGAESDRTVVVRPDDSYWTISAAVLDLDPVDPVDAAPVAELTEALIDLNAPRLGHRDPTNVRPGDRLELPTTVSSSDGAPGGERIGRDDDDHDAPTHVGEHVVAPGDTLWDIADDRLGDGHRWGELWEANRGEDLGGGTAFVDPHLIEPGWTLEVPGRRPPTLDDRAAGDDPAPTTDADQDPAPREGAPSEASTTDGATRATDEPATTAVQVSPPTEPSTTSPSTSSPSTSSPSTTSPSTTSPSTTVTVTTTTPAAADVASRTGPADVATTTTTTTTDPAPSGAGGATDAPDPDERSPRAPSPIGIEHAALLCGAVLTLVAVRRRRALRAALPHARIPAPPPEVASTERRLRTIDPGERAARVDVAVRAIAHRVAGTGAAVGTVRVDPDGEVTVRLTGPADVQRPWVGAGATWTLPASVPIEMLADEARRVGAPCLALVTIGIDESGADVLLDLEAAGTTVVDAHPSHADPVVRAIGTALATSLTSEVVHIVVGELDAGCLFDHPNARRAPSAPAAIETAIELAGSTAANATTTFELRSRRTGGEMWEPAVVLLTSGDDLSGATGSIPGPGHGVATVAAAAAVGSDIDGARSEPGGARLVARSDRWQLIAFGEEIEIHPIGVTEDDVGAIAEVLSDARNPVTTTVSIGTAAAETAQVRGEPYSEVPHAIVVSLLGGVRVTDAQGAPGRFERSKTVELIAWLATHRERATRSAARTALWEMDVRDATFANVVSEARRGLARLVPPPEGGEWLARTLNESLPLHDLVVTDADLVQRRVEHARLAPPAHAIDVLRPAVEMIRDLPFAGTSYLWPDADGLTSNLVLLATTAAAELAGHALSVGDTDLVFWATGQGLTVLPGHEELIGLRMRAHARAGDLAGVRQEWECYERVITADSWSDGEPAPKLLDLRRELLSSGT
ncbi:LysM peptidoglycan-binding domain-containing protein [Ilumatobacter sp.]|uniref:LysM peptidoglycan-binding domain-containing protein n=1 Tax=Ilumatobacter sp. TaxID=1967498 RepID=UPI003B52EF01